ncbi:hypothetical protein Pfo_011298 [Paulownia fortunei]|nr:hypothetical protein Pfo_011298 [Paulownia fortunei]
MEAWLADNSAIPQTWMIANADVDDGCAAVLSDESARLLTSQRSNIYNTISSVVATGGQFCFSTVGYIRSNGFSAVNPAASMPFDSCPTQKERVRSPECNCEEDAIEELKLFLLIHRRCLHVFGCITGTEMDLKHRKADREEQQQQRRLNAINVVLELNPSIIVVCLPNFKFYIHETGEQKAKLVI